MQKLTLKFKITDNFGCLLADGKRSEYFYNDLDVHYSEPRFSEYIVSRFFSEYWRNANIECVIKFYNDSCHKVFEHDAKFTIDSLCEEINTQWQDDIKKTKEVCSKFWGFDL